MKEFTFWDEDDLSNLPADFKLVPFNVVFIEQGAEQVVNETPKTSTAKMSPWVPKPSTAVKPESSNRVAAD